MGEIFRLERPSKAMAFTGERFTSAESGQIEIEHIHRYFLARHFCRGKDVLDVASGEGYGAALLAQVASSVIGVDIADDAVEHAAQNYVRDRLSFRKGDGTQLPVADASVDAVVSFETIEHLHDHQRFLTEIRRVLRPGGFLILSTPERDIYSPPDQASNPHHIHELTRREFYTLVRRHFPVARFFGQRAVLGSAILADEPLPRADLPVVFEQRGDNQAESSDGLARATYLICVASEVDIGPLPESLFIYSGNIDKVFRAVRELHAALRREQDAAARLHEQIQTLVERSEQERITVQAAFRDRDLKLSAVESRLLHADQERTALQQERTALQSALTNAGRYLANTGQNLASANQNLEQCNAELAATQAKALVLHRNHSARLRRARRQNVLQFLRNLPRQRSRIRQTVAVLRSSALFDSSWYLTHNDDVRERGLDPVLHYARFGAEEGRDPGPQFSTTHYLLTYPDVIAADYNPLEHYELFGRAEGRSTVPPTGPEAAQTIDAPAIPRLAPDTARVVFVSGEPDTPGHSYRVQRYADAACAVGAEVMIQTIPEAAADLSVIENAHLAIIWRAEWNAAVERIVASARQSGTQLLFDIDDLMFDPEFARISVIDGIRSQGLTEEVVRAFYARLHQTMRAADFCSASTPFLAAQLRRWQKPSFVLPNGFDEATWRTARLAVRSRRNAGSDGLLRIGYASGSRTHQKDFGPVAGAVARVLAERPECRLVLFRRELLDCLDLDEFPDLVGLAPQVEWRELVPVQDLPRELARFDINLAPLEVGNPFCESKSELKFFEAALVGVPSICSPSRCYSAAVRGGETGILADDEAQWYQAIIELLDNQDLRERMARAAYHDVLWTFGPERRSELIYSVLEQTVHRGRRAARAFELDLARWNTPRPALPNVPKAETILHSDAEGSAELTVIVPLHDYAHYVLDALDSIRDQTLPVIDLVVIDDCSSDDSVAVARDWIDHNLSRFNRVLLLRNQTNVGLALTRNVGFGAAETPFVLQLDADNKLLPGCASRCLETIKTTGAAFVYPTLKQFGDAEETFSEWPYNPATLASGNYIDATALVRLSAWAAIGGYDYVPYGWEDYDLWCRFAERGLFGHHVPEILALYRVHSGSMLRTVTDTEQNKQRLIASMRARHPWILEGMPALAAQ